MQSVQFSENLVARRWALSWYGFCGAVGLAVIALHLWRHGFSQPEMFAVPLAILFLSLIWLRTTLKSGPPTKAKFGTHATVFLILTGADSIIALFRL